MTTNNDIGYRIAESQGNWPAIEHGQATVSSAGTAVQLNNGTSVAVPDGARLAVTAKPSNAGVVFVGSGDVTASNGFEIAAGDGVSLNTTDVSNVSVDAANDGDGVSWIVEVDG